MPKVLDLVGKKFGRLTVQERYINDNKGGARWCCSCDCGNFTIVRTYHLTSG